MAYLILQTQVIPNWQHGGSTGYVRVFSSQPFYEATTGAYVPQGNPQNINSFCQEYTCTISGTNFTIPAVTLATTVDSTAPNARYAVILYDAANVPRYTLLSQAFVDTEFFQSPAESSILVADAGSSPANQYYDFSGTSAGYDYYNVRDESASITLSAIVNTGSEWRLYNAAGTNLYHTSNNPDSPWDGTWITGGGSSGSAPVPTVSENNSVMTGTWEQLTLSNLAYDQIVPIGHPAPFFNEAQTKQYIRSLVGDGTTPYAARLRSGKTELSADPLSPQNPIAVGTQDLVWLGINETVYLAEYGTTQADLDDALTDIGSTQTELRLTSQTSITANTAIPSNVLVSFDGNGSFTVAGSRTLTIGSMVPTAAYRVFYGAGSTVFAKNATGGQFRLEWWAGPANSGDCSAAMAQVITSMTTSTGSSCYIGPGIWKHDGVTIPSGCFFVGAGRNTNITSGTIFKPFSTSAVDLFTCSGGFHDTGLRRCTVSTDGTVSTSSRALVLTSNAATSFGFTLDEVHLHATLAGSTLWELNDAGSNLEIVDITANQPFMTVPANGIGIKGESVNVTWNLQQPSWVLGAGADAVQGTMGWMDIFQPNVRGPGSFANTATLDRAITGSIDGGTGILTLATGSFDQNDIGQLFEFPLVIDSQGHITGLIDTTHADTTYTGSNISTQDLEVFRYTPSPLAARSFLNITGDHNTINIYGGADEGLQYYIINDAATNVSPINLIGCYPQSWFWFKDPCVINAGFGTKLYSNQFTDDSGVTATLNLFGGSIEKRSIYITSDLSLVTLDRFKVFGAREGDSRIYNDLGFHEGLIEQFIGTKTSFLDTRLPAQTNPVTVFASASQTAGGPDQPLQRIGRLDPTTLQPDFYYDVLRNYDDSILAGYLCWRGNQELLYRGYDFDSNLNAVTFKGGVISPAQITATQNNYNPGDSSMLWRLNTDASRNITGVGLTKTQRSGEIHFGVNTLANNIVLQNQNAGSAAANRFLNVDGADITVAQNEIWIDIYDATTARWRTAKLNITGVTSNGTTITNALPTTFTGAVTMNAALGVVSSITISGGGDLIFTGTTGQNRILITDNLADSLTIGEAANAYLTLTTTNSDEKITAVKALVGSSSIKSTSPTAGIGYAVGAGSAVAQGTSRTTTVVINAVTGAITLFSAAGSATPASFTVTNSAVAATDIPHVVQKSGTDKYIIEVTAVGAGSFEITSYTTGGTTTETPVFSFAVIKGVTS